LAARIHATIEKARQQAAHSDHANALGMALKQVSAATQAAWATGNPQEALANAVPYMQAFGHTVLAWIWLDVAVVSIGQNATDSIASRAGIQGATAYFYAYELPKITAWLAVVESRNLLCANLPEEAF
jgi:butyryl-CoA dehydrogenase